MILAAGFVARVWMAHGTFMNPDECLHFQLANQPSFAFAFRESHHTMHPPLLIVILYFWRALGTSELVLRLPSAIAGIVACWFTFRWLRILFGAPTGWLGLIFMSFLPSMIGLSTEVRQYSLLLAFVAACLYFLERALAEDSPVMMLWFSISLCLGLLSQYSGALFALAMGAYCILRMLTRRPSLALVATWISGQAVALGVALFLYFTYVAKLVGGTAEASQDIHQWMRDIYLRRFFFHPGHDHALAFIAARTGSAFQFIFGQRVVGDFGLLMFLAAFVLLKKGKSTSGASKRPPNLLAMLLVLPFAVNLGAALAGKYPYGGTRHSAFLAIFGIAGVSLALVRLVGQRIGRAITIALLLCIFSNVFATPPAPYMNRADQNVTNMQNAIQLLDQHAANGEPIFVDYQSSLLLGHYLCRQRPITRSWVASGFDQFECQGHRVISLHYRDWVFTSASFSPRFGEMVQTYGVPAGTRVWIFQAGWGADLARQLPTIYPEFRDLPVNAFGRDISVFELTAGQPMPAAKPDSTGTHGNGDRTN